MYSAALGFLHLSWYYLCGKVAAGGDIVIFFILLGELPHYSYFPMEKSLMFPLGFHWNVGIQGGCKLLEWWLHDKRKDIYLLFAPCSLNKYRDTIYFKNFTIFFLKSKLPIPKLSSIVWHHMKQVKGKKCLKESCSCQLILM